MPYTTLITPDELLPHLGDPDWAIFDCRYTLGDDERGAHDYQQAHIPGAVFVYVGRDLAAPHLPGQTGRHPLPSVEQFAAHLSRWGVADQVQVVVYDDSGGGDGSAAVVDAALGGASGGSGARRRLARLAGGGLSRRSGRRNPPGPHLHRAVAPRPAGKHGGGDGPSHRSPLPAVRFAQCRPLSGRERDD